MKQLKLITMLNLLRIQLNNSHFFFRDKFELNVVRMFNNSITLVYVPGCYISRGLAQYCGHRAPITIGPPPAHGPPESRAGVRPAQAAQSHSVDVVIHNLSESHKNNKYSFCYGASRTSVLCLQIFSIWCEPWVKLNQQNMELQKRLILQTIVGLILHYWQFTNEIVQQTIPIPFDNQLSILENYLLTVIWRH